MKTLILGAKGMLGHALRGEFLEAIPWDLPELDITNEQEVHKKIADVAPDVVINAAAYTDVDAAEEHEDLATRINGDAVSFIAESCLRSGAVLMHYSTDYVFDGTNEAGYRETDVPTEPVNAYGRSKLVGENAIMKRIEQGLRGYIIRTSWLFGPHGKNFVDTMVRLGREKEEFSVVSDQYGNPTYTIDLAHATREVLEGDYVPGIYHVTNQAGVEGVSWYDFAVEVIRQSYGDATVKSCTSKEFPLPAHRPHYSMLVTTALPLRRSWQEALEDYLTLKHP